MSLHIELRCDIRKDGRDPRNIAERFCFSDRTQARNPRIDIEGGENGSAIKGLSAVSKSAKEAGWERLEGGVWACPNCASIRLKPVLLKGLVSDGAAEPAHTTEPANEPVPAEQAKVEKVA